MTADTIAIEELQSMLDERNVSHEIMYGAMLTDEPRCAWSVESDGRVRVTRWFDNPKQAIAATLGVGTCQQEEGGWSTEGDHARVWLTCGHDCMVETVADLPNFCPECGAKVIDE